MLEWHPRLLKQCMREVLESVVQYYEIERLRSAYTPMHKRGGPPTEPARPHGTLKAGNMKNEMPLFPTTDDLT